MSLTRRFVLRGLLMAACVTFARPAFAQRQRLRFVPASTPAPDTTLVFDEFNNGLDGVNGAGTNPNWSFTVYSGADGSTVIVGAGGGVTPYSGSNMLKVTTTSKDLGDVVSMDAQFKPEAASGTNAGSYYFKDRTQGGTYALNTYRSLNFMIRTDSRFSTPTTLQNGGAQLSVGTYTQAPSQQGAGNYEGRGFHPYHSLRLPYTNGRWMKVKLLRPSQIRSASYMPVAMCTVATASGTFIQGETISCSPSGAQLRFTNEINPWAPTGTRVLWGLWKSYGVLPTASDTLTGQTSGATRTLSAVIQYQPTAYSGGTHTDNCGDWAGFDDAILRGGFHDEWYSEFGSAYYWDRVTRLYVEAAFEPTTSGDLPLVNHLDYFHWDSDARDDSIAVANLGAYYDSSAGKLYVTWQINTDMDYKDWEIRTSYSDIQTNGLASASVWTTVTANDLGSPCLSAYENISSPGGQPLYISIRPTDRATFTQIRITTT